MTTTTTLAGQRLTRVLAVLGAMTLVGCSPTTVEQTEPTPTATEAPTTTAATAPDAAESTNSDEPPVNDDAVDFASRDIEGEPAPPGIIDMIEGMSIPDGAAKVISANMIRHRDVYYVVAAVAETPEGTQILTYLHAPADQDDIGNGGIMEPLNFAAQQWAPMASASEDEEAYELGERLIVDRP